ARPRICPSLRRARWNNRRRLLSFALLLWAFIFLLFLDRFGWFGPSRFFLWGDLALVSRLLRWWSGLLFNARRWGGLDLHGRFRFRSCFGPDLVSRFGFNCQRRDCVLFFDCRLAFLFIADWVCP